MPNEQPTNQPAPKYVVTDNMDALLPPEPVEEVVETPVVEEPAEEVVEESSVTDPGEFQPSKDYSFEVTVFDAEGKNPKVQKITSYEQWETLLEGESNLGSAKALFDANRLANRMANGLERDKDAWEAKKKEFDDIQAQTQEQQEQLTTWQNEIAYLVGRGDLPKVADEYANADWSDDKVKDQSGVKEQLALLAYMDKENKAREKAKLKPLTSMVDGFKAWKLDNLEKKQTTAVETAARARQQAGARVGASTPAPMQGTPGQQDMIVVKPNPNYRR